MMRQKTTWMVVGSMAILLVFGRGARADSFSVGFHSGGHGGIGVWIGASSPAPMCHPPMHERVIVTRPWHHRPVYMPPHHDVVVVRPPVVERVIVEPQPPIIVQTPAPVVVEGTVEVWITNSNGSRTSVKLTREGSWYVGPRGEYYSEMPTNEQLRVVYGY